MNEVKRVEAGSDDVGFSIIAGEFVDWKATILIEFLGDFWTSEVLNLERERRFKGFCTCGGIGLKQGLGESTSFVSRISLIDLSFVPRLRFWKNISLRESLECLDLFILVFDFLFSRIAILRKQISLYCILSN